MKMVKTSGCLCWPTSTQNKRKGLVTKKSSQSMGTVKSVQNTIDNDSRSQSIPKEHEDFIEMLFPPGRLRSRTLTASLFSPKARYDSGSVNWFRNRTNSLLSTKRHPLETEINLFETVPATPDTFRRGFSVTLPLPNGRWNNSTEFEPRRLTDVWPQYIWRLNQKKQQRCPCTGCEDTCTRSYKHPIEHNLGSYFDNESYYNAHDILQSAAGVGDLCRRPTEYDQPRSRHTVCTEAELYDVPSRPNGSTFCGRHSLRDRLNDKPNFTATEFQTRPRAGSLEQYAVRTTTECVAESENTCDTPVCGCKCSQSKNCGRPNSLYPLKPSLHRSGCAGTRRIFGQKCLTCELKWENMNQEWHPVQCYEPYHLSGRDLDLCGGDSGYILSDKLIPTQSGCGTVTPTRISQSLYPEFDCVIPSDLLIRRKPQDCCHDEEAEKGDYLMPLSSASKWLHHNGKMDKIGRDNSGKYLAMNNPISIRDIRDRNSTAANEIDLQKQEMQKIPPSEITKEQQQELGNCDEFPHEKNYSSSTTDRDSDKQESSNTTDKHANVQAKSDESVENGSEEKVTDNFAEKRINHSLDDQNDDKISMMGATEAVVDDNIKPSDNKEPDVDAKGKPMSVRHNEEPVPPRALRSRSQFDLLLMSPPPQCSFMIDHSYVNVTDSGANSNETTPIFKNATVLDHEQRCKQLDAMRYKELAALQNKCSIEDNAEVIFTSKTKPGYKYFLPWEDEKCKHPGSQYVMLYKKVSPGNDYCRTYLPTPRDNFINS